MAIAKHKQALQQVIQQVSRSLQNLDLNRIQVAKDLYWAQEVIVWKLTEYRSFARFVEVELKLCRYLAYRYAGVGRLINNFKYSDVECNKIVQSIGWTRFKKGLHSQTRKLKPSSFILKYKNLPFHSANHKQAEDGDMFFPLGLPNEQGCKFTAKLMEYGMTESHGKRRGLRDAMISFIDAEL